MRFDMSAPINGAYYLGRLGLYSIGRTLRFVGNVILFVGMLCYFLPFTFFIAFPLDIVIRQLNTALAFAIYVAAFGIKQIFGEFVAAVFGFIANILLHGVTLFTVAALNLYVWTIASSVLGFVVATGLSLPWAILSVLYAAQLFELNIIIFINSIRSDDFLEDTPEVMMYMELRDNLVDKLFHNITFLIEQTIRIANSLPNIVVSSMHYLYERTPWGQRARALRLAPFRLANPEASEEELERLYQIEQNLIAFEQIRQIDEEVRREALEASLNAEVPATMPLTRTERLKVESFERTLDLAIAQGTLSTVWMEIKVHTAQYWLDEELQLQANNNKYAAAPYWRSLTRENRRITEAEHPDLLCELSGELMSIPVYLEQFDNNKSLVVGQYYMDLFAALTLLKASPRHPLTRDRISLESFKYDSAKHTRIKTIQATLPEIIAPQGTITWLYTGIHSAGSRFFTSVTQVPGNIANYLTPRFIV